MLTILHFIDSLGRGGSENLMVNTVLGLEGYRSIVVYLEGPHDLAEQLEAKGIPMIFLDKNAKRDFFSVASALRKIMREHGVSIIHSHSYWTNMVARRAAPRSVKVVNHYHFADYDTMKGHPSLKRMIWLDRLTRRSRHRIVCVSDYVRHILARECGFTRNIFTIHNFIGSQYYGDRPKAQAPQPGHPLRLVAFGGTKREKNYGLLIKVFEALKDEPVSMDVYGGGPLLEELRQAAAHLPALRFQGNSGALQDLLPGYHAYVMCSVSEACPLSPIEAMSAGLPLILSNIPALKEFAADVATFFEPHDTDALTRIIREVLNSGLVLRSDLAAYAQILQRYSEAQFLQKLVAVYRS